MFSKPIVGLANATAGGWGNLGGGITNLAMPFVFLAVRDSFAPGDDNAAWRLCFWLPALLHFGTGLATLTGRDLPDGNVDELELSGAKQKSRSDVVLKVGFSNLNGWLLCVLYGMSFGVELTVTNEAAAALYTATILSLCPRHSAEPGPAQAATYFFEYHGLSVKLAGALASCFGLMRALSRASRAHPEESRDGHRSLTPALAAGTSLHARSAASPRTGSGSASACRAAFGASGSARRSRAFSAACSA